MHPLSVSYNPWEVVGIEFVTGLPSNYRGHDGIMIVVDHLTRMAHAIPCHKGITTQEIVASPETIAGAELDPRSTMSF